MHHILPPGGLETPSLWDKKIDCGSLIRCYLNMSVDIRRARKMGLQQIGQIMGTYLFFYEGVMIPLKT